MNKLPKEYLTELISEKGTKPFYDQCVPVEPELLEIDNYRQFLEKRRQMLMDKVNNFINSIITSI